MRRGFLCLLCLLILLGGCAPASETPPVSPAVCTVGFGRVNLPLPTDSTQPLYIAGYHNGWEIEGVLDEQEARAVWLDDGTTATVLIAIDCVGLGSDTVAEIRRRLSDFSRETGCDAVQVVATHTHAGVDTLGLWGPIGVDGKHPVFMETLIAGAVTAAKTAYADRSRGTMYYSATETAGLQADSRLPSVWDNRLYQLRFVPENPEQNGIRIFSFAAHAESLRGDNRMVSRDYPGAVCDRIGEETGEDALYLPGAIGGLIMTPVLVSPFDAVENMNQTAKRITEVLLSPANEQPLSAGLSLARQSVEIPLENTAFLTYRFLGILQNPSRRDVWGTYFLQTELSVLQIGEVTLALLPGELFPELIRGTGKTGDPVGLATLAKQAGVDRLMCVGLANDEIGYILPPSDFVLHPTAPYFEEAEGDHYEETNSVGPTAATALAEAFEKALRSLA